MLSIANIRTLVETDLSDAALTIVAAAEWDDLIARFGDDGERTIVALGGHQDLVLLTPADTISEVVEVTRYGETRLTTLDVNDYYFLWGGRVLRRIGTGTNSSWTWAGEVRITYTPQSRANLRNRVHIDLIKLAIQHNGVSEEWFGDYKAKFPTSYYTARERIMRQMSANRGMILA